VGVGGGGGGQASIGEGHRRESTKATEYYHKGTDAEYVRMSSCFNLHGTHWYNSVGQDLAKNM
jgi:hypothetical protein